MGREAMLLQSSLRDSIMFHDVPRTASWAKFSRPFGTNFVDLGSHAGAKSQCLFFPDTNLKADISRLFRPQQLRLEDCGSNDSAIPLSTT
jgi:hypothetical protein